MAYSVEFRRLRAGQPVAGDGVDFFGFTALSRGVRLIAAVEQAEGQERARPAFEPDTGADRDMA